MNTPATSAADRPLTVLLCALGGEGGGVLAEWLVETAAHCGYSAQSTSIPGVAQRTGATTYYIEVWPLPDVELGARRPVFSLSPVPGALDLLGSSELLETARQITLGMTTRERTHVITSSHRTLTTREKMPLGDGRVGGAELLSLVRAHSCDARVLDMAALAQQSGTLISAVLCGAIAGCGVLPFARSGFEEVIRASGRGVAASLRGFALGHDATAPAEPPRGQLLDASQPKGVRQGVSGERADRAEFDLMPFPPECGDIVAAGVARQREYQDADYAQLYLARLTRVLAGERASDPRGEHARAITCETARYLALWMAFDDIVRVADLKTRAARRARVRAEVQARDDELVRVYDHFKPGLPEFAALLQTGKRPLGWPLKIGVHTVSGFIVLKLLSRLRWLRRRGQRFALEQSLIERWLAAVANGTGGSWQLGFELAQCGRLIKGYGATNERGKENLLHVLDELMKPAPELSVEATIAAIRAVRTAALADDSGKELDQALRSHGARARPVKPQPIAWVRSRKTTATARPRA